MPPKAISKAVSKRCQECKKQVPVATKHCHCGHQFFEERRRSTTSNPSEVEELDDLSPNFPKDMKSSRTSGPAVTSPSQMGITPVPTKSEIGLPASEGKRRSERVKREKPNFYDAMEYDNQMRKARKERQKEDPPHPSGRVKRERKVKTNAEPVMQLYRGRKDDDDDDEPIKEKKKKKKKKNNNNGEKKEEEIDEDIMTGISPEKEKQTGNLRRPILLGSIIAMLSAGYIFRLELIGDLTKEKEALAQHTDTEGSNQIRDSIRETHLEYFRSLTKDKK